MTRAENAVAVILLAGSVLPCYGILYYFLNDPVLTVFCFCGFAGVALSGALLRYTANVRLVSETLAIVVYLVLLGLIYRTGGIASPCVIWLGVCPVMASTTGGARPGWNWTCIVALSIAAIFAVDTAGLFPAPVLDGLRIVGFISLISFILVMAVFLLIYERINSTAIEKLDHALGIIRTLAIHDELTGLVNRREVLRMAMQEKHRTSRKSLPFCLCLIDVDHFKKINDSFGHMVGDEVLRRIAGQIRVQIRVTDCVGRYGGEEFLLVLGATDMSGAADLMERIRLSIAGMHLPELNELPVTISVGIAQYRHEETIESTLSRADKALYAAKAGGRNKLALAETEELGV